MFSYFICRKTFALTTWENRMGNKAEMCRKKLSDNDLIAASNLRAIWEEYKLNNSTSQGKFAAEYLDWSQGNFSQYLTAVVPIGMKSLLKPSRALGCHPGEIRPEFSINERTLTCVKNRAREEMLENKLTEALEIIETLTPLINSSRAMHFVSSAKSALRNK